MSPRPTRGRCAASPQSFRTHGSRARGFTNRLRRGAAQTTTQARPGLALTVRQDSCSCSFRKVHPRRSATALPSALTRLAIAIARMARVGNRPPQRRNCARRGRTARNPLCDSVGVPHPLRVPRAFGQNRPALRRARCEAGPARASSELGAGPTHLLVARYGPPARRAQYRVTG